MMRSLYSGVSGLRVHQTKMDVIGNNIANVNTVGFKSSSVSFSELFYQTTQVASGPNADTGTGGQNAKQIGLGAALSSISVDITGEGGTQTTNKPFDLKINGDSFFIVQSGGSNYFTKAGNFKADPNGNLVTDSGAYVMGYVANTPGGALQTDALRPIQVRGAQYQMTSPEATTDSTFTGNINKNDSDFSGTGYITRTVYVYDNLGYKYGIQTQISQIKDTDGNPTGNYDVKAVGIYSGNTLVGGFGTKNTDTSSSDYGKYSGESIGTLTFDQADGIITSADGSLKISDWKYDNDLTAEANKLAKPGMFQIDLSALEDFENEAFIYDNIWVDFSALTTYGSESTVDSKMGDSSGAGTGKAVGNLLSVGISSTGDVVASYDNGDNEVIGKIAVAIFDNPAGLEKVGQNMFAATLNSGEFNGLGLDISAAGESFSTGTLEMSNVDLAAEFTDMIVTQRGFQANSRIITTSDSMIEELLSLKR